MTWTLVTGGARGLGAEVCRKVAADHGNVVVHYNKSMAEAEKVAEVCRQLGVEAECLQGNFSSLEGTEEFIERYLERFSQTKNLICNVGNYLVSSALQTSTERWYQMFQTNLHAPFVLAKALTPSIKTRKGNIVNVGVVGLENIRANTYATAYCLTKSSLLLFTRALARELAPFGVRVNMVSPGYLGNSVDLPAQLSSLPMERTGTFEEVARVVAFLLEEESQYITGQNIEVAGGVFSIREKGKE